MNPDLELPHYYRAAALYHLGLLEEADRAVLAGMDVNPRNRVEPLRLRGNIALLRGEFERAVALLEEVRRISEAPVSDWYLAQSAWYDGEHARAESLLANLRGGGEVERRAQATLASFLAAGGERARAEALLLEVLTGSYMDHHVAYAVGAAYAGLGDSRQAQRWLRQAAETGLPCFPWFWADPLLDPLRGDGEFRRFMETLRGSWEDAKKRYADPVQQRA